MQHLLPCTPRRLFLARSHPLPLDKDPLGLRLPTGFSFSTFYGVLFETSLFSLSQIGPNLSRSLPPVGHLCALLSPVLRRVPTSGAERGVAPWARRGRRRGIWGGNRGAPKGRLNFLSPPRFWRLCMGRRFAGGLTSKDAVDNIILNPKIRREQPCAHFRQINKLMDGRLFQHAYSPHPRKARRIAAFLASRSSSSTSSVCSSWAKRMASCSPPSRGSHQPPVCR